jgi:DNA helicase-2/ATP-dependent DNA helicase PcrA
VNEQPKEKDPFSPVFVAANSSRKLKQIGRKEKTAISTPQKSEEYDGKLKEGIIVEHQRFGRGKIVSLEGAMPNSKATILFDKHGQKQLLLKFAKLKIIS